MLSRTTRPIRRARTFTAKNPGSRHFRGFNLSGGISNAKHKTRFGLTTQNPPMLVG